MTHAVPLLDSSAQCCWHATCESLTCVTHPSLRLGLYFDLGLDIPACLQALKSVPHAAKVKTVGCRELERSVEFADQHGEKQSSSAMVTFCDRSLHDFLTFACPHAYSISCRSNGASVALNSQVVPGTRHSAECIGWYRYPRSRTRTA